MKCIEFDDDLSSLEPLLNNTTLVLMLLTSELGLEAEQVFKLAQTMKLENWQSVLLFRKTALLEPPQRNGWFGPLAGQPPVTNVFAVRRNAQSTVVRDPITDLMHKGAPSRLKILRALSYFPPQV